MTPTFTTFRVLRPKKYRGPESPPVRIGLMLNFGPFSCERFIKRIKINNIPNVYKSQHQMLPSGEKSVESSSLQFYSISRSDAGTYICRAENGVGPPVTGLIDLTVICKYNK